MDKLVTVVTLTKKPSTSISGGSSHCIFSYFGLIAYGLYAIGFWDTSLLKDTIFWVLFLELPLFAKTIEKAKNNCFFAQLIKENIALIVIIEFILNFWTFGLIIEIIIVPVAIYFCLLYGISMGKKIIKKLNFS